ncbi:MAG: hypothetical protein ABJE95_02115 [Byssovorax sp.]
MSEPRIPRGSEANVGALAARFHDARDRAEPALARLLALEDDGRGSSRPRFPRWISLL